MSGRAQEELTTSGFFVLRTPALPLDVFEDWGAELQVPETSTGPLGAAVDKDREWLREKLRRWIEDPRVREAVFIASPSLEESIPAWLEDPDGKRGRLVERGLVRYFTRMTTRPTPFGLFSACSVGTIGSRTDLAVPGPDGHRRRSRLDMGYLDALASKLSAGLSARAALTFRPNPTLYRTGNTLRYVETRTKGYARSHHLVAVEERPAVTAALEAAADGARLEEIAARIAANGVPVDEAQTFAQDLVDSQLLAPDLEPPLTGRPPLDGLTDQLRGWPEGEKAAATLRSVGTVLSAIDDAKEAASPSRYRELAASLEELPVPVDVSMLFQVDLMKDGAGSELGGAVLEELMRAVDLLPVIVAGGESGELVRFRERFRDRFEGRGVPLLTALDDEVGVGFGPEGVDASPLLAGLPFPDRESGGTPWGRRERLFLRRVTEALAAGAGEVVLAEEDLERLRREEPAPLPDAFAVTARLEAGSHEELERGAFRVWVNVLNGPPGTRLMGRFCHADPALERHVRHHLEMEEALDPEAIYAEIVHVPQGREGNVLARPVLRGYEIPLLGSSGAPPDRRIQPEDVLVSLENGRIVLRSVRLGRRIVPRLTTAHNFGERGIGIYRFLCTLASQAATEGLGWSPGVLASAPHVPRIRIGRVVLAPATWRVWPDEAKALGKPRGAELIEALRAWRAARGIPRRVALTRGDNALLADLENVLSAESFAHELAGGAVLQEPFPGPETAGARGPDGVYAHEIVLPLVRRAGPRGPSPTERRDVSTSDATPRWFPPGSEWLSLKLYAGPATADRILTQVVLPLVRACIDEGKADRWFFIRYGDPDWHLRVRLRGDPAALTSEVLPRAREAVSGLLSDGRLHRMDVGTYEREIERYGGAIEIAEELFHADSDAVARMLEMVEPGDAGADERWRLAIAGAHALLTTFGLGPRREEELSGELAASYARELRPDAALRRAIGERFRREREALAPLLDPGPPGDHPLAPGIEVLRERSDRMAPAIGRLAGLERAGKLSVTLEAFAASMVHMHVDRLLRSRPRAHELVLYEFLARLLRARRARDEGDERHRRDQPKV